MTENIKLPALHDPDLQASVSEAGAALSDRIRILNQLSADILALEGYLNACAVRVVVSVPIPGELGQSVEWARAEPTRWRLVYRSGQRSVALIEAKADERLTAKPCLPRLVRLVAEASANIVRNR